ncbi:2-amino-4-hydroxy-6-hydroxymethyldihydropteridine diphosphokinase [Sphingomonas sp. PP-F2F-A104-K0414]|uniref:2-amino-4-hydroxy-6- hydroxymethyldihydropteridine diphosphokinase n=1 Tax=Sphingomonas sp. PP-F2F-A104-K0414 TaxID=2135661 RepID=UPI0010F0A7B7|nr:2-amino-4-hydroxy-6-hydroxymethyldihydropteridine diphosphokinase [Sphingomonas sp. PP-F2F-A104-K0414]TCP95678.1 2-amino-4-hydroxy-6-hydroxymethyldihydropteridine diphosphokinase [Sphingomonas sp. PP-F2F-A104-K0414]
MSPATPHPMIARAATTYAIALGSNRRGRHGAPEREIAAALEALGDVVARSPTVASAPLGPSNRRYANAVALIETAEDPAALLVRLKRIERTFGRRPGRRWGSRVLDLDIVLWSGGAWSSSGLTVPHAAFRTRGFVLGPLAALVPKWRDPLTHRTIRQLAQMVDRRHPRD